MFRTLTSILFPPLGCFRSLMGCLGSLITLVICVAILGGGYLFLKNQSNITVPSVQIPSIQLPSIQLPSISLSFPQSATELPSARCHRIQNSLPDPACTTGAILTTDRSVLCTPNYMNTIPTILPQIRNQIFAEYGDPDNGTYQLDWLVPLEIGGSNDVRNLWTQPTLEHSAKQILASALRTAICTTQSIDLTALQNTIAQNWKSVYQSLSGQNH